MADNDPLSDQPKKVKFQWLTPARTKGKARVSNQPVDPAMGIARYTSGYQQMTPREKASIESLYGRGTPSLVTGGLRTGGTSSGGLNTGNLDTPTNPAISPAPAATNPLINTGIESEEALAANPPEGTRMPLYESLTDLSSDPFVRDNQLSPHPFFDTLSDVPRNPVTGEPVAMTPEERLADARRRAWLMEGGSAHTMHEAQTAAGIRPVIDARATPSPRDIQSPMSSGENVRGAWGWGPSDFGNQVQPLPDLPRNSLVNRRAAQQRSDWARRFDDARARLYDALAN